METTLDQHQQASPMVPQPSPKARQTLKDVMDRVEGAPNLSGARRTEILSAVRTFARCIGLPPSEIVAHPGSLRKKLRDAPYALADIKKRRWQGICSLMMTALRISGFSVMPGRRVGQLSPAWAHLRSLAPGFRSGIGLSRFMSFCTAEGIEPGDLEAGAFDNFRISLEENSLVKDPGFVYRTTCILWNETRESIAGWPILEAAVPSVVPRCYSLEWDSFPATFLADVEKFLSKSASQDPLADDYTPSIRPATRLNRQKQIRQMASALVASGFTLATITDLAVLVHADNAKRILKFFLDRAGGTTKENIYAHAVLLRTIARHWVARDEANILKLEKFCKGLASKRHSMTDKNRDRLRQFDDPRNVEALLDLPAKLKRQAEREDFGSQRVLANIMYAVAIELLTVAPIRIKNLTELQLDHVVQIRRGKQSTVHLVIPGEAVKNGVPIEVPLSRSSGELLLTYISKYRPRIARKPSPWLFPNAGGEQRNIVGFGRQIGEVIERNTGIKMHPHLFRHLAVKFLFEAHPEDIETARRLLGHKSLRTTLRAYSEGKTEFAHKRYESIIEAKREQNRGRWPKNHEERTRA